MTVRVFADTNIVDYAESDDGENSRSARAIIEASPVISTQVVNETIAALTGKYGFSKPDAYEVAVQPISVLAGWGWARRMVGDTTLSET